jgi:mannose-6-phosphate isomerase-like protein (cupin superfamily)
VAPALYGHRPELTPERRAFYERLQSFGAAPLWEVMGTIIPPEPRPQAQPVLWKYDQLRPLLIEAGRLLTAQEAERRVLILENPGLPGRSQATGSLYAGLQLILPGETARTHRHATSALRFVLEGTGAYTSVDGERATMHPGDFIVTPSWRYHDHGNPGGETTIWLDGLDVPIVNLFDASFAEHHAEELAPARAAASGTPPFSYPYARTRAGLEELRRERCIRSMASSCVTSIPPPARGRCRRLPHSCSCCRKGSPARRCARPTRRSTWGLKGRGARRSATQHSTGARVTSSSCRPGRRCASTRWAAMTPCSSVFPIAPRNRPWGSGERR